ncbi:MAG TPA: glycosyltransferase family 39 protein [Pyrinomonadaceae bacterium]|nr:glycosyltransferase family 39 protein [Pyrinomonadaceae bacterium]
MGKRRIWIVWLTLLFAAFTFRFFLAVRFPNDAPDDGRVYAQLARNLLEQRVYSHETEAPYVPSLIRLPGYPLTLAAIYSVFGHNNNRAVRIVQAVVDSATCGLVAWVSYCWTPDEERKRFAATASLVLAALCPFTAIYVATILTEVPTSFFAVLACLTTTLAFDSSKASRWLWALTGLVCGIAVLFRPDSGLFACAIGLTMFSFPKADRSMLTRLWRMIPSAAILAIAFCVVLVPWTIRNERVFHVFQPLAPAHGEMPGEFVPRGYLQWLRTWIDEGRYIGPVLWSVDTNPIQMDSFPDRAFDSAAERDRVAALIQKYNHPDQKEEVSPTDEESTEEDTTDEESPDEDEANSQDNTEQNVEMTPQIDEQFAQLARERITRSRLRYYLVLPIKRAISLWSDTHSQYYPFEGELFPLEDLDYTIHQQYWLPFFAGLTWIYTLLGALGAWLLWRMRTLDAHRWVTLAVLIIVLRLGFFSTLENPEPRYVVELFPFISILGGIAIAFGVRRLVGAFARVPTEG